MNSEMLKGHLDSIILSVIASGATYGYSIIKEIGRRSGQTVAIPEGTIYPALHRLENAGLITSVWTTLPNGRKRREYALTRTGTATLEAKCDEWTKFALAMGQLLAPRPA